MTESSTYSTLGMLYCALSAVAYAAYAICLRYVSGEYNAAWINCVQASVSTAVFGVYLACQAFQGRRALPPRKELVALVVIGLITQLGGVCLVRSMDIVGVAVAGTLQMGVTLAGSAVLGLVVLRERITLRQVAAISLITVSVVLFSRGSQSVSETATSPSDANSISAAANENASSATQPQKTASTTQPPKAASPLTILWGIAAGVLSGIAFAILTVGVRKTVSDQSSPEAIVFLINAMGVVFFLPWCLYQVGPHVLMQTTSKDFGVMLGAGLMNLFAFLLLTKSLQWVPVVRVNVLNNALTMALTVIGGILLFAEPWNRDLGLGIALAAAGIVLISLQAAPESEPAAAGVPNDVG
ncbi:MAG: DMT family transporter [Thermoguttaceae bacterium]